MNPTSNGPRFHTYDRALEAVRLLRGPIARLRRASRSLADQLTRAGTSVVLNLAEGSQRRGADRVHFYRMAAGSANEARAALDAAEALGLLDAAEIAAAWNLLDQVGAMLWPLTR